MLPAMRKQLKDCEKGIENLLNAVQAGIVTNGTKERLEKLEEQKESLQVSIMQAHLTRPKYSKDEIVDWITQFRCGNLDDKQYQKEIIDIFLNSIYVYDDRLVFTYNYRNGTETISRKEIEAAFRSDLKKPPPPKNQSHRVARLIFFVEAGLEQGGDPQSAKNVPVARFLARGRVLYRPPTFWSEISRFQTNFLFFRPFLMPKSSALFRSEFFCLIIALLSVDCNLQTTETEGVLQIENPSPNRGGIIIFRLRGQRW